MASPSELPSASYINDNTTAAANSTVTNGTSPYLYHHPHHGGYGGGSINLAGVLVGILLPHAVCTLFVLARAGSRGILLRKWFLDDSLVVAAWLCSTAVCVVYSMSAIRSQGSSHNNDSDDDNSVLQDYLLRTYLGLIFYQLCLCLTKLSILALYLRMFAAVYASEASAVPNASSTTLRRHHLRERRLAWLTVAVVITYGVPLLWMSIMQCYPSSSSSGDTGPLFFGRPAAVCFSFTPLLITSASLHTATDAWLIVLVVPFVLTRLRFLPRSQRWALAAVLSLSIFVIAASLTRLQLSLHANWRPSMSSMPGTTSTPTGPSRANTLGFFVMTILECDIALICASAPTLRPLLARLAPRLGLGDDGGGNGHGPFDRRSGVSHRRSLFHPRGGGGAPGGGQRHDEDSEDLTSVVSYHGYPWTRNSSPARSRSRSRGRTRSQSRGKMEKTEVHQDKVSPTEASGSTAVGVSTPKEAGTEPPDGPSLPVPIFSRPYKPHRTPTDRSMRSQPRSLPQSRDGSGMHAGDSAHGTPLSGGGVLTRRPSSVFFFENSDFYDQYFSSPATTPGGGGPPPQTGGSGTKKAGVPGAGIGLGIVLHPRGDGTAESPRGLSSHLHRNGSQESFVMGLNDPASPTRLTRLTGVSGYSGETYTEEEGGERRSGGGSFADLKKNKSSSDIDEYELADFAQKTTDHNYKTETSFLDDDTDNDGDDGQRTPKTSLSPGHPTTPSNKASPRV